MRHINDPVTGRCVVCDSRAGASTECIVDTNKYKWNPARKAMAVNAFKTTSPTDSRDSGINMSSRASNTSASQITFATQTTRLNGYDRTPTPPRVAPTPVVVTHGDPPEQNGRGYYARNPQPGITPEGVAIQKTTYTRHGISKTDRTTKAGFSKNARSNRHNTGANYGGSIGTVGSNVGKRRCLALFLGILILLLIIGIICAIYFGTQAVKAQRDAIYAQYTGGVFVDGVYVVQLTNAPSIDYLIFGYHPTPCNPNATSTSNATTSASTTASSTSTAATTTTATSTTNTAPTTTGSSTTTTTLPTTTTLWPCVDVTTRIVAVNQTTTTATTIAPTVVTASANHVVPLLSLSALISVCLSLVINLHF